MRETLDRMIASLREYFSKMTPQMRRRLLILASAIIVLAIVIVAFLSRTRWVPLPGTANFVDPSAIAQTLAEIGIPTRHDGLIVLVPEGDGEAAMTHLQDRGLVSESTFSNSYMEDASGFGVSSAHAKELYDLQTGDNIRTMLLQNPRIQNAHVIVNSGETSPFRIQTNTRAATASVQVTLNDGGTLSQNEAQTIANTVRGAVPGIEYENIYISDNRLNNYSAGDGTQSLETELDMRILTENRLMEQFKARVEQLLSPIYGMENLKVQPYVKLNFDTVVINKIEFEPPIPGNEEGMLRTSEEIYERSRAWADAEGIPGTDTNGMGTAEYPYGEFGPDDYYMRDVIRLNYELNETRTAIEAERGKIEELSVTVLINSQYMGEDVTPPEFTAEVIDMVSKGIGVSPMLVSVQHVPFKEANEAYERWLAEMEAEQSRQFRNWLIEQILKYGTIITLIVMVFMLIRMILKGAQPVIEEELVPAEGPGGIDLLIDEAVDKEYEDVDLHAKSAGLEQIERFIDKDAAAVTQLLRNWLTEE